MTVRKTFRPLADASAGICYGSLLNQSGTTEKRRDLSNPSEQKKRYGGLSLYLQVLPRAFAMDHE